MVALELSGQNFHKTIAVTKELQQISLDSLKFLEFMLSTGHGIKYRNHKLGKKYFPSLGKQPVQTEDFPLQHQQVQESDCSTSSLPGTLTSEAGIGSICFL